MGGGVKDVNGGVVAEAEEVVAEVEDLGVGKSNVGEMGLVDEVVVGSDKVDGEEERWRLEEKSSVAGRVL